MKLSDRMTTTVSGVLSRLSGEQLDALTHERHLADEQFRLAVEACPSGMLMVDNRGIITLFSAEAERLFGYKREEIIGQQVDILVPPRFRQQHPEFRDAYM